MFRNLIYSVVFCFLHISVFSQEQNYYSKVESLDSIINAYYEQMSGEKGEMRNWELFRFLFKSEAKIIPVKSSNDSTVSTYFVTQEEWIDKVGDIRIKTNFEKEISRQTERFGCIAHVLSTYAIYSHKGYKNLQARGIHSIQLVYEKERWWIVSILYMRETSANPIPEKYLQNKNSN